CTSCTEFHLEHDIYILVADGLIPWAILAGTFASVIPADPIRIVVMPVGGDSEKGAAVFSLDCELIQANVRQVDRWVKYEREGRWMDAIAVRNGEARPILDDVVDVWHPVRVDSHYENPPHATV